MAPHENDNPFLQENKLFKHSLGQYLKEKKIPIAV